MKGDAMMIDEHTWELLLRRLDAIDKTTDAIFQKLDGYGNEHSKIKDRLSEIEKKQRYHNGQHANKNDIEKIKNVRLQIYAQWITVAILILVTVLQVLGVIGHA
jgi:tetrahydromethanopterin S-methyltransferase subunit G